MASSSPLSRLAASLRPKVRDTRKFRLKSSPKWDAEDAKRVALAFEMVKTSAGNPDLTFEAFVVELVKLACGNQKDALQGPEAEAALGGLMVFVAGSGAAAVVVA